MAWAKGNNECFLLLPLDQLRAEMRHLCEPIVKSRYPKLVEKGKKDKYQINLIIWHGMDQMPFYYLKQKSHCHFLPIHPHDYPISFSVGLALFPPPGCRGPT
jgi:hypothetical protein